MTDEVVNPEPVSEPKKKAVVTATRVVKNKSWLDKVFGEHLNDIGQYVLFDVLIPAGKGVVWDAVVNSLEMIIYGETRGRRTDRRRGNDVGSIVSYGSFFRGGDRDRDDRRDSRDRRERRSRPRFDSTSVEFSSRADAERALDEMEAVYEKYDCLTVSEFLEICDLEDEFTDRNYGWTSLRLAEIYRNGSGYVIDLPDPRPLPR